MGFEKGQGKYQQSAAGEEDPGRRNGTKR